MGQAPAWKEGEEYEGALSRRLLSSGLRVRPGGSLAEELEVMVGLALRGHLLRNPGRDEAAARQEIREVLKEAASRQALLVAEDEGHGRIAGFLAIRADGSYWVQEDGRYRRRGVATLLVDSLAGPGAGEESTP